MKTKEKKPGIFSQIRTSKYYEAAETGFWRIWKNKTIWFWGLFISTGTATSFSQNEDKSDLVTREVAFNFFINYWQWLIIGSVIIGIVVLFIWVFSAIARAGVIIELDKKQNNNKYILKFKKIWRIGLKEFQKIIRLDLFMLGIVFLAILVNLIMSIPFFVFENKVFPSLILGVTVLISLLILIGLSILKPFVQISLLLANLKIREAFLRSWNIIKKNLKEFFKLILTCFFIGLIKGSFFALISVSVMAIGSFIYLLISWIGTGIIGQVILSMAVIILLFALLSTILMLGAFFALWRTDILIWWIKMIDGVKTEKKVVKKAIIKNKKVVIRKKVAIGVGA